MDGQPAEARSGRLAERALVLTVVTLILLTPPILDIFDAGAFVFGIPLLHIYCFAAWLLAIACARWLATRMMPSGGRSPLDRPADGR